MTKERACTRAAMEKDALGAETKGGKSGSRLSALQREARKRVQKYVDSVKARGGDAPDAVSALEALLVGSAQCDNEGLESVSRLASDFKALWAGSLAGELEEAGVLTLLRDDPEFSQDVRQEMITPKSTGDTFARQTADIFSRYLEAMQHDLSEAGAQSYRMDAYAPLSHDSLKIRLAGKAAWVNFLAARLDWERSFPGLAQEERRGALDEIYQGIVTGSPGAVLREQPGNPHVGQTYVDLQDEPVLYFTDANGALDYDRRFGNGLALAMLGRIEAYSRRLALMRVFGPKPESLIRDVLDQEALATSKTGGKASDEADHVLKAWGKDGCGKLALYYRALSGERGTPENPTLARVTAAAHARKRMARLSSSCLFGFAHVGRKAQAAAHAGEGWLEAWENGVSMRFERFEDEERRELGHRLHVYTQGLLGELYSSFDVNDAVSGSMSRWMNAFFKMSGLNGCLCQTNPPATGSPGFPGSSGPSDLSGWTEAHRAAYVLQLSNRLARQVAAGGADKIDADLAASLRRHALLERWELLGKLTEEVDGELYIIPEKACQLTQKDFAPFLPANAQETAGKERQKTDATELARLRQTLAQNVMDYFASESAKAVFETQPEARPDTLNPGSAMPRRAPLAASRSVSGEMLRFARQLNSFPISYWQRADLWAANGAQSGQRSRIEAENASGGIPAIVHFFLATTVIGYLSLLAKDWSCGRSSQKATRNSPESAMAAMVLGGGFGLLADSYLGTAERLASQLALDLTEKGIEKGAGKQADSASSAQSAQSALAHVGLLSSRLARGGQGKGKETGEAALRAVMDDLPFVNLWYARNSIDYMVNYHLRETLNPGVAEQSEGEMRERMAPMAAPSVFGDYGLVR